MLKVWLMVLTLTPGEPTKIIADVEMPSIEACGDAVRDELNSLARYVANAKALKGPGMIRMLCQIEIPEQQDAGG